MTRDNNEVGKRRIRRLNKKLTGWPVLGFSATGCWAGAGW